MAHHAPSTMSHASRPPSGYFDDSGSGLNMALECGGIPLTRPLDIELGHRGLIYKAKGRAGGSPSAK